MQQFTEILPRNDVFAEGELARENNTQKMRVDGVSKIIVTKDVVPAHYDDDGILTMNVYDFLLDPASLRR